MHITANSHVLLEEGEVFIDERQDEDNIYRWITLKLPSGCHVKVQRHFSQIGPIVHHPNGFPVNTHVVDGVVVDADNWTV